MKESRLVEHVLSQIEPQRILDLARELVEVPSPSGQEAEVSDLYASYLESIGLDVERERTYPDSPSVIGRWSAGLAGRTLNFNGHLDTVSTPHSPPRVSDGVLYGRGAADMKGGLAAMAEACRALKASGAPVLGSLLLTAHGQHEERVGENELHAPLLALIEKGFVGDATIVAEGPADQVPIVGKSLAIFAVTIARDGEPVHQLAAGADVTNPITVAQEILDEFAERNLIWKSGAEGFVGSEEIFVGRVWSGDYYNRVPVTCEIEGVWRYFPEKSFEEVQEEMLSILADLEEKYEIRCELRLTKSGQGYRLTEDARVVSSLREGFEAATGKLLPLGGIPYVGNASQFNNEARVPSVYHGVDQRTAHADLEYVSVEDMVRAARVFAVTALRYLGTAGDGAS